MNTYIPAGWSRNQMEGGGSNMGAEASSWTAKKCTRSAAKRGAAALLALMAWLSVAQDAYCFYNPSTGRWLSRDPLPESGAKTLYALPEPSLGGCEGGSAPYSFVQNEPIARTDVLGLVQINPNDILQVPLKGKNIGTATIDTYSLHSFVSSFGADLAITVNITDTKDCFWFRWRQRLTIRDQNGRYLKTTDSRVANGALDPFRPDGTEWYYDNQQRKIMISKDGVSEGFEDRPRQSRSIFDRPAHKPPHLLKYFWRAKLELVQVTSLQHKQGGAAVLVIDWGFDSDAIKRDKLLVRTGRR